MRFVPVLLFLLAGCPLDISPETGSIPSNPPPPGGTVSYQQDLQPLFDDACVVCHGSAGGLDLSSRDALILQGGNSGAVVEPGNAADSILFLRVDGSTLGDQMPLNMAELTTFERMLIFTWIQEGALDN